MAEDKQEIRLLRKGAVIGGSISAVISGACVWLAPRYGWHAAFAITAVVILAILAIVAYRMLRHQIQSWRIWMALQNLTQSDDFGDSDVKDALRLLKGKFDRGLEKLKKTRTGNNLDRIPWYLVLGATGAGKTEALRRCGIDWLQIGGEDSSGSPFAQGVGGTLMMDWWFCPEAVLLDTAGTMSVPQTDDPSAAKKWTDFLNLLNSARPGYPINGVVLVVSATSLITGKEGGSIKVKREGRIVDEKGEWSITDIASNLRSRLVTLQTTLNLRFPVYVVVSKCDTLPGFRSFCDSFGEDALKQQVMGWSEPRPVKLGVSNDEGEASGFSSAAIVRSITSFAEEVRSRVLGVLEGEPVDASPAARRELIDLPGQLELLAVRLGAFLEKAIPSTSLEPLPVFFRGVYFTSAMRQGPQLAQIDDDEAKSRGVSQKWLEYVSVDDVRVSFFLGGLFRKKIFPEKGLITPLKGVSEHLRQTRRNFYSIGLGLVGLWLFFTALGYVYYHQNSLAESQSWTKWTNDFHPIIRSVSGKSSSGLDRPGFELVPGSILEHAHLADIAAHSLESGILGWPYKLGKKLDGIESKRKKAQWGLFEQGAVFPVVTNTLVKMSRQGTVSSPEELGRLGKAIQCLVSLETAQSPGKLDERNGTITDPSVSLNPLLNYLCDSEVDDQNSAGLQDALRLTYRGGGCPDAVWPPKSLLFSGSLSAKPALSNALSAYFLGAGIVQTNLLSQFRAITNVVTAASAMRLLETNLWVSCRRSSGIPKLNLTNAVHVIAERAVELSIARSGVTGTNSVQAYTNTLQGFVAESRRLQALLTTGFIQGLPKLTTNTPGGQLIAEIANVAGQQTNRVLAILERYNSSTFPLIIELERSWLNRSADEETTASESRAKLYEKAVSLRDFPMPPDSLVGNGWEYIRNLDKERGDVVEAANRAATGLTPRSIADITNTVGQILAESRDLFLARAVRIYQTNAMEIFSAFRNEEIKVDWDYLTKADEELNGKLRGDLDLALNNGSLGLSKNQELKRLVSELGDVGEKLAKRLVDGIEDDISAAAGFPLVENNKNMMTARNLRDLFDLLKNQRALVSTKKKLVATFDKEQQDRLERLLKEWDIKLQVIWDNRRDRIRSYQIGFESPPESDQTSNAFFRYGILELGSRQSRELDLSKIKDWTKDGLTGSMDQELKLRINVVIDGGRREPATIDGSTGDKQRWGLFHLLSMSAQNVPDYFEKLDEGMTVELKVVHGLSSGSIRVHVASIKDGKN